MIDLDKRYNDDPHQVILGEDVLTSLPVPIRLALSAVEAESEPQVRLQHLCLSLIPMTFQVLALTLSSEYLHSSDPPDADVTDSLLAMVRRPGPGKWLGFARGVVRYFSQNPPIVISAEAVQALEAALVSPKRPHVRVTEAGGKARRLAYADALVNVRNRFAHSRQISRERAEELAADHLEIWKAFVDLIAPLFEAEIVIPPTGEESLVLMNERGGASLPLHPLVISLHDADAPEGATLLLEEIKGKQVLYLNGEELLRRRDEYLELMRLLEARTVRVEGVSSGDLSATVLGERIDRVTTRTLSAFSDSLKYLPAMFVPRPSVAGTLDAWLESSEPGCILAGEPGAGKTSLVADWTVQRRAQGDHVLLLEAAKLEHPDLPRIIEETLGLSSSLKGCLEAVTGGDERRFVIVIDAANEFVGTGLGGRGLLWREINSLVERFEDFQPQVKCLVTTRSDTWAKDFPRGDSADRVLKRRLFFGSDEIAFPSILVGDFDVSEAERAYENARSEIPAMAPLTPYAELPGCVQKLILSPFRLRLILQTYAGREVPAISERRLLGAFAKEKALAEKGKMRVLFALVERMAELTRTEVSLDELLYGTTASSRRAKKAKALENIVFDPRPQSLYRQLIDDGLIEERIAGEGEQAEERVAFAQEKINQILDREFKRKQLRNHTLAGLATLFFFSAMGAFYAWIGRVAAAGTGEMLENHLFGTSLSTEQGQQLLASMSSYQSWYFNHLLTRPLIFTFLLCLVLGALGIFMNFAKRFWGERRMGFDLPLLYLRRRYLRAWGNRNGIAVGFLTLLCASIFAVWRTPGLSTAVRELPVVVLLFITGGVVSLLTAFHVAVHLSVTPEAVYALLGRGAARGSAFSFVLSIPLGLLFIALAAWVPGQYRATLDSAVVMENAIRASGGFRQVSSSERLSDRLLAELIDENLAYSQIATPAVYSSAFIGRFTELLVLLMLLAPFGILAQWLLGAPAERMVRKRLEAAVASQEVSE